MPPIDRRRLMGGGVAGDLKTYPPMDNSCNAPADRANTADTAYTTHTDTACTAYAAHTAYAAYAIYTASTSCTCTLYILNTLYSRNSLTSLHSLHELHCQRGLFVALHGQRSPSKPGPSCSATEQTIAFSSRSHRFPPSKPSRSHRVLIECHGAAHRVLIAFSSRYLAAPP